MIALDVNPDNGISTSSLDVRKKVFGTHYKDLPTRTPFCTLVLEALDDFMLKILIVCAFVSIGVDMSLAEPKDRGHAWIDGTAILMAVAIVSLVSAWSDFKKEGQFLKQQLLEENSKTVKCMRDSKETTVHRNYLKVGDIIKIQTGMNIPVDGCIVNGVGIMSDESAMTGESDHLPKEALEKCFQRQAEFEADSKNTDRTPHDVPSPILLSGT